MSNMKRITFDTFHEFSEKIERAKAEFIPMLPFVKLPLHDFDRYKVFREKGIYLIDDMDGDYCLYHLYHLTEGDDTLRATLILPSSWEKRFQIIEKSISNLKEWFLREDDSSRFIIQSLEYGEIEYYPTLSHYLIPTIIRNGFMPKYRMYMKRDFKVPVDQVGILAAGLEIHGYSSELFDKIEAFYYKNPSTQNYYYFTNCTHDEFEEMFQQEFTVKNSKFVTDADGLVVAGIIVSREYEKIWVDNFSASPAYDGSGVGEYLLGAVLEQLSKTCSDDSVVIYLNRDCRDAIAACEKNGFVPFEFWTDMIFER